MYAIQTIGIDLAKNVFSIHGVDAYGKFVPKKCQKKQNLSGILKVCVPLRSSLVTHTLSHITPQTVALSPMLQHI